MIYSLFMYESYVLHACSILYLMMNKCMSSLHDLKLFINIFQNIVCTCTNILLHDSSI